MIKRDKQIIWERYLEILKESRVERYLNMYNKLFKIFPDAKAPDSVYNPANCELDSSHYNHTRTRNLIEFNFCLKNVIDKLRRDDIIQWYIKKTINETICTIIDKKIFNIRLKTRASGSNIEYFLKTEHPEIYEEFIKLRDLKTSFFDIEYYSAIEVGTETLLEKLEHYIALNIQDINNFRFVNQSIEDVLEKFQTIEREWLKSINSVMDITDDLKSKRVKTLLKIDENNEWQIIDSSFCTKEGKAMGHCGNNVTGGIDDKNTKLLSYRTITHKGGKVIAKPHLTFIYHLNDMSLSERKGAQNDKPVEKYHEAILKLLMLKKDNDFFIKKLKNEGYLPQNNFEISDLSENNRKILEQNRPDLFEE
jgi:hypothetical protein